jgi:YggT family protein
MNLLFNFIALLCQVLTFAILIRALLSWFPVRPDSPLLILLYQITEPVLAPLRRIIPRIGMIDITPLIAIVLLQSIYRLLP